MGKLNRKGNLLSLAILGLLFTLLVPVIALGDRGRNRGRRGRDFDRFDRKCAKFVNCHDARDGRWDGRGRRRSRFDDFSWRRQIWRDRSWDRDRDGFWDRNWGRDRTRRPVIYPGRFRNRDFDDDNWRTRRRIYRRAYLNRRF